MAIISHKHTNTSPNINTNVMPPIPMTTNVQIVNNANNDTNVMNKIIIHTPFIKAHVNFAKKSEETVLTSLFLPDMQFIQSYGY